MKSVWSYKVLSHHQHPTNTAWDMEGPGGRNENFTSAPSLKTATPEGTIQGDRSPHLAIDRRYLFGRVGRKDKLQRWEEKTGREHLTSRKRGALSLPQPGGG
jgi:hypothetical protein